MITGIEVALTLTSTSPLVLLLNWSVAARWMVSGPTVGSVSLSVASVAFTSLSVPDGQAVAEPLTVSVP